MTDQQIKAGAITAAEADPNSGEAIEKQLWDVSGKGVELLQSV